MCCPTGNRSRLSRPTPMRAHHKSLSVDSFFFSQQLGDGKKANVVTPVDEASSIDVSFSVKVEDRCPSPLRQRAKTETFRDSAPWTVPKAHFKARKGAKKSVKFSRVEVRGFNLIIGDHPSCAHNGLPVSLGWERTNDTSTTVDDYESKKGPKKSSDALQLSRNARRKMLIRFGGYSDKEIFHAERKVRLRERDEFFGTPRLPQKDANYVSTWAVGVL